MKRALVISGGGSKGAFAVGVLKALAQTYPQLQFDIFVGTSAGSLVVTLASLRQYDLLQQIYTTTSNADIFTTYNVVDRINEHSLYEVTPAWNLINTYYPDAKYQQLLQSGKKVFLTAVCLQTSTLTVFGNDASAITPSGYTVTQTTNADHYRKALLSSCCEPVFMPPIEVNLHVPGNANPGYQYVDGGVLKYVGVQMAIDAGADEIFTILLSPEITPVINTQFTTLFPILQQTIDILTTDIGKTDLYIAEQYTAAVEYIQDVKSKMLLSGISQADIDTYFNTDGNNPFRGKKPITLFTIRPDAYLGGGPGGLVFNPTEMQGMLAKGEAEGQQFIASLPPGKITWA